MFLYNSTILNHRISDYRNMNYLIFKSRITIIEKLGICPRSNYNECKKAVILTTV